MKKRLILTLLVLVGICQNAAAQRGGDLEIVGESGQVYGRFTEAHALIIGESNYINTTSWRKLPGVKEDLKAVKKLFEEQGFHVVTIEDANSRNLRSGITDFFDKYAYNPDARIVFYFAGHGATVDLGGRRMGYIVPIDAPSLGNNSDFLQTAIPMTQFETWAKQYTSRHILFMFDSCFSGTVFRSHGTTPPAINRLINQPVRQFITSGDADESVPDQSVFRAQLEHALRNAAADTNKDGYVTGTELGLYLFNEVSNYMNGRQNPRTGKLNDTNLDKGDFIFAVSSDGGGSGSVGGGSVGGGGSGGGGVGGNGSVGGGDGSPGEKGTAEFFFGTWVATIENNDNFDEYRITFSRNGRCTVNLSNDNAEQETTGTWSWDSNSKMIRINARFRNAKITYQQNIQWISLVGFLSESDNNTFNILAKASANAPNNIRFTFFRE